MRGAYRPREMSVSIPELRICSRAFIASSRNSRTDLGHAAAAPAAPAPAPPPAPPGPEDWCACMHIRRVRQGGQRVRRRASRVVGAEAAERGDEVHHAQERNAHTADTQRAPYHRARVRKNSCAAGVWNLVSAQITSTSAPPSIGWHVCVERARGVGRGVVSV